MQLPPAALALLQVTVLLSSLGRASARADTAIFNMMMKNYKPEEAPDRFGVRENYIQVGVQAMVETIEVDEHGQTIELQSLLRLTWTDVRLRYRAGPGGRGLVVSHASAGMPTSPKLWLPSLVFHRALAVKFDNSMDNFFVIRQNGTVTWQRRVLLRIACELSLKDFPWDTSNCRIKIRQNLDHETLMLNWTSTASFRPVHASPHFSINGFELTSLSASSRTTAIGGGKDVPRSKALVVKVTFKRVSNYYVINDVVPTSILVLVSYLTFWLPPGSVVARTLVAAFMLLACFIVSAIAGRAAPPVAVLKALDVWNFVCLFFILWALVQSVVVYQMRKTVPADDDGVPPPKRPEENGSDEPETEAMPPPPPGDELGPLPPRPRRRPASLQSRHLDLASRALHPLGFCVLVVSFAAVYS